MQHAQLFDAQLLYVAKLCKRWDPIIGPLADNQSQTKAG